MSTQKVSTIQDQIKQNAGQLLDQILIRIQQSPSSLTQLRHQSVITMAAMQAGEDHTFGDKAVKRYEQKFGNNAPESAAQLISQCLEVSNRGMRDSINQAMPEALKNEVQLVRRQKAHSVASGMSL